LVKSEIGDVTDADFLAGGQLAEDQVGTGGFIGGALVRGGTRARQGQRRRRRCRRARGTHMQSQPAGPLRRGHEAADLLEIVPCPPRNSNRTTLSPFVFAFPLRRPGWRGPGFFSLVFFFVFFFFLLGGGMGANRNPFRSLGNCASPAEEPLGFTRREALLYLR